VINKATPTLVVTNSPATYTGSPVAANVTAGSVAGVASSVKYNGSTTTPTGPGTYAINADFSPTDSTNYNALTNASAGNFVIAQPYTVQYLQPLDQSTTSVVINNAAKAGRVVPVKVKVMLGTTPQTSTDIAAGSLTIQVVQRASCAADAADAVTEYTDAAGNSNVGNQFRWSATDGFWIYNLDTKASGLVQSKCYRVNAVLGSTVISTSTFAVLQMTK
jgi:hypothetical protein